MQRNKLEFNKKKWEALVHFISKKFGGGENLDLLAYGSWQIQNIEYYGHDTMYTLDNESKQSIRVRVLHEPIYKIGNKVGIVYTGPPTVVFTKK